MKRYLRKKEGFTLIEIIVVLIIIAVLAAMLIPVIMDRIEQARISRAKSDVTAIKTAIQVFNTDTGAWPRRSTTSSIWFTFLVSSTNADTYTFTNTNNPGTFPRYAGVSAGTDFASAAATSAARVKWNHWKIGTLDDQLVTENITTENLAAAVNADGEAADSTGLTRTNTYTGNRIRWRGPYMGPVTLDPWGTKYLVNVRALGDEISSTASGDDASIIYGWAISAGQNRVLETKVTDPKLNTTAAVVADNSPASDTTLDDIGVVTGSSRKRLPGMNIYGEPE